MTELFRIRDRHSPSPRLPYVLELDEFVPLQFRTYVTHHGCGYLQLGNGSTTLLDISVDPGGQVVRALTVTSVESLSEWPPEFQILERSTGLPAISTEFEGYVVVDLPLEFEVAAAGSAILAYWEKPAACDAIVFHDAEFLVQDGKWIGVCFRNLEQAKMATFLDHFVSRSP